MSEPMKDYYPVNMDKPGECILHDYYPIEVDTFVGSVLDDLMIQKSYRKVVRRSFCRKCGRTIVHDQEKP